MTDIESPIEQEHVLLEGTTVDALESDELELLGGWPSLIPWTASGLYTWRNLFRHREELRLDVDGRYPQMSASGTSFTLFERYRWVASLAKVGPRRWAGPIWLKDGNTTTFGYTNIDIKVEGTIFTGQRSAKVRFIGGGQAPLTRTYKWTSSSHHNVEF